MSKEACNLTKKTYETLFAISSFKYVAMFTSMFIMAACSSQPEKGETQSSNPEKLAPVLLTPDTKARTAIIRDVSQPLEKKSEKNRDRKKAPQRFDVKAHDVPAQTFFSSLVEGTDNNLLVHPDVSGVISLNVKQVTLLDVLSMARDLYGYDFSVSSYGYQVFPGRQKTRIFPINYLNVKRQGVSGMRVSSGQVTMGHYPRSNNANNQSSTDNSMFVNTARVETQSGTDFWQTLGETLNLIISTEADASVVVDAHAGVVIVKGMPDTLRTVENYLNQAELNAQKQVLIEARIVEVNLSNGYQKGINWNTLAARSNKNSVDSLLTSTPLANPDRIAGIFSLNFNVGDFAGALQLLETQGNVKVLSSPRIATVNNQKAVIKVGSDEFFVTEVRNNTVTSSTGTTQSPELGLTPFFSGISLDVTPLVGDKNDVILHVHPTVTEVEERVKTIELDSGTLKLPLAFSRVRETDSIVRADSGQIVVIGGLMQNRQQETEAKVPWLGDIPLIGWLFRQTRVTNLQSELVILLQPRIAETPLTQEQVDYLNHRYADLVPEEE